MVVSTSHAVCAVAELLVIFLLSYGMHMV